MATTTDPAWIKAILARLDAGAVNPFGHRVYATPRTRANLAGVLRMLEVDELPFEAATRVVINGDGSAKAVFQMGTRQLWFTCDDSGRLRVGRHHDRLGDFYDVADRNWVRTARNAWASFLGLPDTWGVYAGRSNADLAEDVARDLEHDPFPPPSEWTPESDDEDA